MHIVYHSDGYPETRDEKVVERVTSGLVEVNTVLDVVFRDIEESLAGAKKKNTNVAPADLESPVTTDSDMRGDPPPPNPAEEEINDALLRAAADAIEGARYVGTENEIIYVAVPLRSEVALEISKRTGTSFKTFPKDKDGVVAAYLRRKSNKRQRNTGFALTGISVLLMYIYYRRPDVARRLWALRVNLGKTASMAQVLASVIGPKAP
jgi:hypothetical protein